MNDLMNINIELVGEIFVTDSRNIAENFNKRHDHVLRDIEKILLEDLPKIGEMFSESQKPDNYGRQQKIYYLNRDAFSLLAMGFNGRDALKWKFKYISAFNKMEEAWNSPEQVMARALKFADRTIHELTGEVSKLTQVIEEQKPDVEFAQHISKSKDTIDMLEMSKVISKNGYKVGRTKLFKLLRRNEIIMQDNQPYQKYIDWFDVIEQTYDTGYQLKINFKLMVTVKGQKGILRLIKKELGV